ncbi:2-amino-4-hydroxy-6-hydroxymethyldihydropteridine diphosphokinase [Roseofilum capinflatum]|uniref:2-amino-4-hydroxy-6-hydroxymethyldihydropteridine diphosphokinase n=1 Tax=Roseofilum capinflatum BLCC-M114 TaxID=3022440 RepID=A0ABT7BCW9_9CYAN|nr:2-amino-4-hydroxy-6-hydroxymethyldihydropteridine diphosphokinase [Roseofilum capinflatum]MDJ1177033.1 2-amino-4-hydroxy-6-hydroxymethyldihydropteridine diphosphokinase [Roseofilum capinflatum BLCC-M114]
MVTSNHRETPKSTKSAIALGSNLGDSKATLNSALSILDQTTGIRVQTYSSYYHTAPIGPAQPDFLNACAILQVELTPQALLNHLLRIEQHFGRVRRERWGPRTLDLDILLFEDLILSTPELQIPHPCMTERAFVLVPLAEIAPDWIEPVSKEAIAQLVKKIDCSGVTLSIK